jgi:hypothetical protein
MDIEKRFYIAMGTYGILAVLVWLTLDGKMRLATWIFLAGLALRTIIHMKARE